VTGDLHARVRHRRGSLDLDVDLHVAAGEVVAVVGPNGAGKTTLLHCLAGLLPADQAVVRLGERVLEDTAAGTATPPERRRAGVVFPDHRLFEHLTAVGNVAFGPRAAGTPRRDAEAAARRWLAAVDLGEHAGTRPDRLSSGQRQRVALARALATEPDLLLLDEPLSALDVDTRDEVRRVLRRHLATFAGPTLLVTHEPLEALVLADRLVVLEAGRVTQVGTPAEVARRPRSPWVARLVGVNLLRGRVTDAGGPDRARGGARVAVEGGGSVVTAEASAGQVLLTVHPRAVSLHRQRPGGSPRNVWRGEVGEVELAGDRARVVVDGAPPLVAEVTAAAVAELALADGGPVWVSFKAADVEAYPA
jgi:molybdate transport system ATP-binding protein